MKKMFKKAVAVVLTAAMAMSVGMPAFAAEDSEEQFNNQAVTYMDAKDKQYFAKQMKDTYEIAKNNGETKVADRQVIDSLIERATFAKGTERETLQKELEEYGVYMYESAVEIQPYSSNSDVKLETPTIFYEAWEDTWTVTCGGNWLNSNWDEKILPGNIGDEDVFGVGYTYSTRPYNSYVIRANAYITDGLGNNMVKTTSRIDADGGAGFGFALQDSKNASLSHIGHKWYGSCTYDWQFGSYNGVATAYYIHTYNDARIQEVNLGLSGKIAGVGAKIINEADSFKAYSSDKRFGVQ